MKPGQSFLAAALVLGVFATPVKAPAASVMAADQAGGYSGIVLEKVARLWQPPADSAERMVRVRVAIDGDGKLLRCEPLASTYSAAGDKSMCTAVREAGNFGTPPYGAPIDVFLAFWSGGKAQTPPPAQAGNTPPAAQAKEAQPKPEDRAAQAKEAQPKPEDRAAQAKEAQPKPEDRAAQAKEAESEYLDKVKAEIRSRVAIPAKTPKGKYTVSVKVRVTAKGLVSLVGLSKSCGRLDMDQAITSAVGRTGLVGGSPLKKTRDMIMTFAVQVP